MNIKLLTYFILLNIGQVNLPTDDSHCQMHVEHLNISIEGIFTSNRKSEVTQKLSEIIANNACWQIGQEMYIVIDGSNKVKITGLDGEDNPTVRQIRDCLKAYDWDYLHELMTVNIRIKYDQHEHEHQPESDPSY